MPSTCEFQLNSPNRVYYSGQIVSGTIVLKTTSQKEIRAVRLRFLGQSKVRWTETKSHTTSKGRHSTRTVHFQGDEVYIDNTTVVQGEGVLPAGTHTYTFNIALPLSCPTSFEGKYGHIRYGLWLTVDRPMRFDNEFNKSLTVLRTVDLNLNPVYRIPLQEERVTSLCCWPCNSGSISYTLRVPLGAYAPGQTLRYSLLIHNQAMADVCGYKVEFNEHTTFTAHSPRHKTRKTHNTLVTQNHADASCLRLTNRQFDGELVLPALPPDSDEHGIIRVTHSLYIELSLDGCHSEKKISVPIFIGTVPIRENLENASSFAPISPSAPLLADAEDGDMPPSYGDFKPPSFEEAIRSESPFKDPDANEHTDEPGFRPLYPMYPHSSQKQ